MILDLSKISSDSRRIVGDDVLTCKDLYGGETQIDYHVELDVRRLGTGFHIHGNIAGIFSTACHRCLKSTEYRVNPRFELVVRRTEVVEENEDPDVVFLPLGENKLSMDGPIRENLVVSLPMQVFCREDCKGLCGTCGTNLNDKTCSCAEPSDNRWAALNKIKGQFPTR